MYKKKERDTIQFIIISKLDKSLPIVNSLYHVVKIMIKIFLNFT